MIKELFKRLSSEQKEKVNAEMDKFDKEEEINNDKGS